MMVDLSTVGKSVVKPTSTHLLDKNCTPKVSEGTRVQFSFLVNSCGTTVKVVIDVSTLFKSSYLPPDVWSFFFFFLLRWMATL